MRYLAIILVSTVLLGRTVAIAAPPAPVPGGPALQECTSADLSIVGKNHGKDFLFKLRDDLEIKLTGPCVRALMDAFAKNPPGEALRLSLAGVPMNGLDVYTMRSKQEGSITVAFNLNRKPNEEDNRKAWDMLLRKQTDYMMTLPVALRVGNNPPVLVQSEKPFRFYITSDTAVFVTAIFCLIVFVLAYYFLVKDPTALRDSKNGYYSLGKSQMAFWGLVVALSFAGTWYLTGTMERIPDQVLILLGISGATGLGSVVIGQSKRSVAKSEREKALANLEEKKAAFEAQNRQTQGSVDKARIDEVQRKIDDLNKTEIPNPRFWHDICDDGNGTSVHRLQVVIWTIVLGVVFVQTVLQVISMPEFSQTLLILLGISNGTYLGLKVPEKAEINADNGGP